jgi:sugar/nucleoside kinase (ribokinase family)
MLLCFFVIIIILINFEFNDEKSYHFRWNFTPSTDRHLRFSKRSFKATYGGGEFNVAVSLANYGMTADYVTKILIMN